MSYIKSDRVVILTVVVCCLVISLLLITPLAAQSQAGDSAAPKTTTTQSTGPQEKQGEPRPAGYGDEILNNPNPQKTGSAESSNVHRESVDDLSVEPRREPSAAEILRELSRHGDAPKPVILPVTPGQQRQVVVDSAAIPPNSVTALNTKLFPDGYRIVDRPGRLAREGDYYTFSFETRTEGPVEIPIRLLPNRLLEDMEIVSAGGTKPIVFIISGEMTTYHGVNYLLVQKLLTRSYIGNLK